MMVLIQHLPEWVPQFFVAALQTLELTVVSFIIAVIVGITVALLRRWHFGPVQWPMVAFVELGRGTPALVILFLIYFALPDQIPALSLDSFTAAVIGLGLQGGAVLSEVFRAGIEALDRGQGEASMALGMTPAQTMLDVIAPQAIRVVLPPVGNYAIGLLKDTSIASIIAAPDLMLRAKDLASSSFLPMQVYCLVAVFYFALSYPMSLAVAHLEFKLARHRH
jgi:His/Glu/Gln/Arg/opine family amino acid ABC transporter permease subunit